MPVKQTIADVVYELLAGMKSLHFALRNGLINYSALARHLKPYVQEKLENKDVSDDAIVMASRRFVEQAFDFRESKQVEEALAHSSLLVRERMVNVYYTRSSQLYQKLADFAASKVRWEMGEKMYIIQRTEEISVIANRKFLSDLLRLAPEKNIIAFIERLTLLTVVHDEDTLYLPGVFLFLIQKVEGINIVALFSTYRMFSMLFSEEDAPKAYERLNRELIQLRNAYKFQPAATRFGYED